MDNFRDWRSGTGKEPSGGKVLRLIQDRPSAAEFEKISTASQDNSATTNRRLGFQKSRQLFIATNDKPLPVANPTITNTSRRLTTMCLRKRVAVCVSNEDGSPVGIHA
jgi:hypothetical protein